MVEGRFLIESCKIVRRGSGVGVQSLESGCGGPVRTPTCRVVLHLSPRTRYVWFSLPDGRAMSGDEYK